MPCIVLSHDDVKWFAVKCIVVVILQNALSALELQCF